MNVLKLMKIINTKLPPYIWAWIAKYKNYEEQSGSGTLVFENTYGQKFSKFEVYGNTTQDGTPTPENLVPINNVTGENKIKVSNFDNTEKQTVTFPLSEGQYMAEGDYLADDGIHHVKGEYVFTGQEPFNKQLTRNIYYMANSIYTELGGFVPTSDKELTGLLCTNFIEDTYNHVWSASKNNIMCVAPGTSNNIRFYANEITSVANLKAWLAEQHTNNTPVKIQFPLATETIEPYTQAQQEAWNAIKELHTYLDYTQISQENDGLPFILKVSVN